MSLSVCLSTFEGTTLHIQNKVKKKCTVMYLLIYASALLNAEIHVYYCHVSSSVRNLDYSFTFDSKTFSGLLLPHDRHSTQVIHFKHFI